MNWKLKAFIQNGISLLPSKTSYDLYFWAQRKFGALRTFNPLSRLRAGVETCRVIRKFGANPVGKMFLEIGTGRAPFTPIAYWLNGANGITTIDLNPYLNEELTLAGLAYIRANKQAVKNLLCPNLDRSRWDQFVAYLEQKAPSLEGVMDLCQIDYRAPCDASQSGLTSESFDFHASYTVFEHVPASVLSSIISEGSRLLAPEGLFVHRIDYSDHFSHSDPRISKINFLQFGGDEWERYAGNRYMYMNRLRHDDYMKIYHECGHITVGVEADVDNKIVELLNNGQFPLDDRFARKSKDVLATTGSWIVTRPLIGKTPMRTKEQNC